MYTTKQKLQINMRNESSDAISQDTKASLVYQFPVMNDRLIIPAIFCD